MRFQFNKLFADVHQSTPEKRLLVQNTIPKLASFVFTAYHDDFVLTGLTATTSDSTTIAELIFKEGETIVGYQSLNGNVATETDLALNIPIGTSRVIDVYAVLGGIGTNGGTSGSDIGISLVSYRYNYVGGTTTLFLNKDALTGNSQYVYKSKPTIATVALPSTVLATGTQTLAKFSVTADAAGPVHWNKIAFKMDRNNATVTTPLLYNENDPNTPIGICGVVSSVYVVCINVYQTLSNTNTYVLTGEVDSVALGGSISTTIPSSTAGYNVPTIYGDVASTPATFIWSDDSIIGHDLFTPDWNNDYLVHNLPTTAQVLSN